MDWKDWPMWATIIKRLLTVLVLSGFAWHAYAQCKRYGNKMLSSERLTFLMFSVILASGVLVNFVAIFYALEFNLKQGPAGFGIYSLFIAIVYLVFSYRSARRVRF